MEGYARAKPPRLEGQRDGGGFMSRRRFQGAQAPFSPLPKPTPRAAPGKPLIFHGFASECPESQHGLAPVRILS
jgi:hypothetical protein